MADTHASFLMTSTENAHASKDAKVELDEAARLFALKKYESASDVLAEALETLRDTYGEDAPELAPVLHQYGRALLEHVIEVSGALGGGGTADPGVQDDEPSLPHDGRFSFVGDAEDAEGVEPKASGKRKAAAEPDEEEEPEDDDDDLGVAFTVLDLSRVIFERILGTSESQPASSKSTGSKSKQTAELKTITGETMDEVALLAELGEVYNDLGDVGLETENFEQASEDYGSSLRVLAPLLAPYSRRLSDAHLRLGLALEFHPNEKRRPEAFGHIEQAAHVLQRRLVELEKDTPSATAEGRVFAEKDNLAALDDDQRRRETRDVKEVLKDLEVKLDEMKAAPTPALKEDGKPQNPELETAIRDAFLNAAQSALGESVTSAAKDQPVNDLSARVKRKKKN